MLLLWVNYIKVQCNHKVVPFNDLHISHCKVVIKKMENIDRSVSTFIALFIVSIARGNQDNKDIVIYNPLLC